MVSVVVVVVVLLEVFDAFVSVGGCGAGGGDAAVLSRGNPPALRNVSSNTCKTISSDTPIASQVNMAVDRG